MFQRMCVCVCVCVHLEIGFIQKILDFLIKGTGRFVCYEAIKPEKSEVYRGHGHVLYFNVSIQFVVSSKSLD